MTKGARAFRDLERLRGGREPRGGRPDRRQGARGRRPASLPPRRGAWSGRASATDRLRGDERGLRGPRRGRGLGSHRLHASSGSGQVATGVDRRPGAGTQAGSPTAPSLQAASWRKGVAQTRCISPRGRSMPELSPCTSLSLTSLNVYEQDAAAQPRWLLLPPTHQCPERPRGGGTR